MAGGSHAAAGGSGFVFFEGMFCVSIRNFSGFVTAGAAVPPTSKDSRCSWTTHQLLFTEGKRTWGVEEMLSLFMSLSFDW